MKILFCISDSEIWPLHFIHYLYDTSSAYCFYKQIQYVAYLSELFIEAGKVLSVLSVTPSCTFNHCVALLAFYVLMCR